MASLFETFVNTELPTRTSIAIPGGGNLTAEKVIRATGTGLGVKQVDALRATSTTDTGSLIVNCTTTDQYAVTALAQALTINNPTGTPYDGQRLTIRLKSAASQTVAYGAQFRGSDDLPLLEATTGSDKTDYLIFLWNSADSKWDCCAVNQGF